ncbi:p450 domain-containing protein [Artemisia annua]|uniref:p450 domain-containing protein n=1 Tax=Artemisia annua TaxID=35608 RepID=A0A2U1KFB9_ARTAN|nr:p450 domain-containing protein [Artemisia annua]
MVDLLLQHDDDPTLQVKFERNGIKGFIIELLSGGTESFAVTVEWAIAEILKKPQISKKATEELDAVIRRDRHAQPSIH